MELMVLDSALQPLGIVDGYSKCTWKRSYFDLGTVSLVTDGQFFPLLRQGAYLYRPDVGEAALLQSLTYQMSDNGAETVTAAGNMLESILQTRVIRQQTDLDGTPEQICRELVRLCCIDDPGREIPGLLLGAELGGGESTTVQCRGENLWQQTSTILRDQELSQRVALDFMNSGLTYSVWRGADRTAGQTALPPVIFSTEWENLLSDRYQWDERSSCNVVYVLGADYSAGNKKAPIVEVDQSNGDPRREMWLNAASISWEKENGQIHTDAAYTALLQQAGAEALAGALPVRAIKSAIDPGANQRYRVDWDLGDVVTYINRKAGISLDKRITEVVEISDAQGESVGITFGNEYQLDLLQVIRKEAKKI